MNLKLALVVIAALVCAFVWSFIDPYFRLWKTRRAAARRRMTLGRRR